MVENCKEVSDCNLVKTFMGSCNLLAKEINVLNDEIQEYRDWLANKIKESRIDSDYNNVDIETLLYSKCARQLRKMKKRNNGIKTVRQIERLRKSLTRK